MIHRLDRNASTRITPQAIEEVQSIPALKNILHKGGIDFFNSNKTSGLMYLSRFITKIHQRALHNIHLDEAQCSVDFGEGLISTDRKAEVKPIKTSAENRIMKRRYATSLATLASKQEKRNEIVENGGIPVLIEFSLCLNDEIISMSSAAAFVFLSKEASILPKLADDNSLVALIHLLQSSNVDIRKDVCRALCNLCLFDGFERKVVKEGIAALIPSIVKRNIDIIEVCLKILLNMSAVQERYPRLEDVTLALIELYHQYNRLEEKEFLLLQAFCNLSSLRGNHYHLVEEGFLNVIEKASRSSVKRCQIIASECLKNLTNCQRTRGKLVDYNVMKLLATLLGNELVDVRLNCLNSFYNFSLDPSCVFKIASGQVISALVTICSTSTSVDMCRTLARIMRILCRHPTIATKLLEARLICALEHIVLQASSSAATLHFCAEAVRLLYEISDLHAELCTQKALSLLLQLVQFSTTSITKESCAYTVHLIMQADLCTEEEITLQVLPGLIGLYSKNLPSANYLTASSLALLTRNSSIDASSAIPVLVQMLIGESVEGTSGYAAAALCNLSCSFKNCEIMLEMGALIPLVQLTQEDDLVTKMTCASILSTLSKHSNFSPQFRHLAVLSALLKLSRVDHLPTQRRIVIALSNLSQNADLRSLINDLHPIVFINSLASKPDESIRRGCAAIVCNLSHDRGNEAAFAKADVVSCLLIIAMVASDKAESKLTCVKALINLMGDATLLPSMIKDGVVWALCSLGVAGGDEMLELCAGALCFLAFHHPKEVLQSPVVEKVVSRLVSRSEVALLHLGSKLLVCLLPHISRQNEKFAVAFFSDSHNQKTSTDVDICRMFTYAVCMISQHQFLQKGLLDSELLTSLQFDVIQCDELISHAYILTLRNMGYECRNSSRVLTDNAFQLLVSVAENSYFKLGHLIISALYSMSSQKENLLQFDHPLTMRIFKAAWESLAPDERCPTLAVAFLFNLSTCELKQHNFVLGGIVRMFLLIWPVVQSEVPTCELAIVAMCHLSCGRVNSSRMVEDSCGEILSYTTTSNLNFKRTTYERCAAAWRNHFCNIGHQIQLVESGALDSVIALAYKCQSENYSETMRHNCTAALRSLTFNPELREILIQSQAVDVILMDLSEAVVSQKSASRLELLREIETESWGNGCRGREKDGKAPRMLCEPICTLYLASFADTKSISLFKTPLIVLRKFLVQVYLEADAEQTEMRLTKGNFHFEMETKTVYDSEDTNLIRVQPWAKQGCEESENPLYFLRFGAQQGVNGEGGGSPTSPGKILDSPSRRALLKDHSSPTSTFADMNIKSPSSCKGRATFKMEDSLSLTKSKSGPISPLPVNKGVKAVDDLVATIKRAKRGDAVTTADILNKWTELKYAKSR